MALSQSCSWGSLAPSESSSLPSPQTSEQADALAALREEGLDLWLEPVLGRPVDIRVAPGQVAQGDTTEDKLSCGSC